MLFGMRFSLGEYYLANQNCFDTLVLPAGYDKDIFVATVLQECGGFGIAQGVANFQYQIELWGKRRSYNLTGLIESTTQEYNVIENYDRIEEWDETGTATSQVNGNGSSNATSTDKSAGVDSTALKTDSENNVVSSSTNSSTGTAGDTRHHTSRIHGNIGVTTAAQMIAEQRKLVHFDPYLEAARIFAHDLLIPLYL